MFYIATTILNWSEEQFYNSSLKHLMKQIDIHMKINNPSEHVSKEQLTSDRESNYQVFEVLD